MIILKNRRVIAFSFGGFAYILFFDLLLFPYRLILVRENERRSSEDDSSMTAQELPNGFTGFANRKPGFEPAR